MDFSQVTAEEDEWWPQTEKDNQVHYCFAHELLSIRILMCSAKSGYEARAAGRQGCMLRCAASCSSTSLWPSRTSASPSCLTGAALLFERRGLRGPADSLLTNYGT